MDKRGGYPGGGSADQVRPPRRLPSAARRLPSGTHRPPDPHGIGGIVTDPTAHPIVQNSRGEWVPVIPLPLYAGGRKRCRCGERFWTGRGYRGHYALVHILGQD